MRLTKGMDGVLAEVEDFDQGPELLNVANGGALEARGGHPAGS